MSATQIERKIDYDMAGGAEAQLFEPIDIEGYPCFCLQFFITGLAGVANGIIRLKVSNDGVTFKEIVSTAFFSSEVTLNVVGDNTYFIFIGTESGVGCVTHITATFTPVGVTGGIIEKVLFAAELGAS